MFQNVIRLVVVGCDQYLSWYCFQWTCFSSRQRCAKTQFDSPAIIKVPTSSLVDYSESSALIHIQDLYYSMTNEGHLHSACSTCLKYSSRGGHPTVSGWNLLAATVEG